MLTALLVAAHQSRTFEVMSHGRQLVVGIPAVPTHCLAVGPLQIAFMGR